MEEQGRRRPPCLRSPTWIKEPLAPKVAEGPLDELGPLDAGDDVHGCAGSGDLHGPATLFTNLDIDLEHALEASSPGHGMALVSPTLALPETDSPPCTAPMEYTSEKIVSS